MPVQANENAQLRVRYHHARTVLRTGTVFCRSLASTDLYFLDFGPIYKFPAAAPRARARGPAAACRLAAPGCDPSRSQEAKATAGDGKVESGVQPWPRGCNAQPGPRVDGARGLRVQGSAHGPASTYVGPGVLGRGGLHNARLAEWRVRGSRGVSTPSQASHPATAHARVYFVNNCRRCRRSQASTLAGG